MESFYYRLLRLVLLALFAASCVPHAAARSSCWRDTACSTATDAAFPGPWDANIYAPESRTVWPKSLLSVDTGRAVGDYAGDQVLAGNGSGLVFDFGIEVGGIVTVKYEARGGGGRLGLAFSEAKNWTGEWSDSSNGAFRGPDGALYSDFTAQGPVEYTMPDESLRGGFRYLTLFLVTADAAVSVSISDVTLEIAFQPTWPNLRAYQGYFHCDDEMLNKIWYSGAYTLQTNAVPTNTGRWTSPMLSAGWANNGTLGPGDTIIVDGAKRDRAVWPGDMGVAVPSAFVSVGDLESVKNALQVMYDYQNPDGSFPEAGPPLLQQGSDTYHMWTMIGSYNYVLYTNDTGFLSDNWEGYVAAMKYILAKVGDSGLLNVTGTRDWARWQTSSNTSESQMILYRTLLTGADLASWTGGDSDGDSDSVSTSAHSLSADWTARAAALRSAVLRYCYDDAYGAFRDNATATSLHPQDANSLAVLFGLVAPGSPEAQSISARLTDNWTPIGPESPELPGNVSPFISSFELGAHLAAGRAERALALVRSSWGWYLNHPDGTGSTVVEGYLTDGSFGYRGGRGYSDDASYVSHSHGWSSGPTSALTEYVAGLRVTAPLGSRWEFGPQFADLHHAQAGFVTELGRFQSAWDRSERPRSGGVVYNATISTPPGTKGRLVLPVVASGQIPKVDVDGNFVSPEWYRRGVAGVSDLVVLEVLGGSHVISVSG